MKLSISMAGLNDELRTRLELASQLLAAHRIRASLQDWNGTSCNVVVVDLADAYGLRVKDIATRRAIPVYAFSTMDAEVPESVRQFAPDSSVRLITERLRELTTRTAEATSRPSESLLVTLARNPEWAAGDVVISQGSRRILLLRSSSRVWANTLSDVLYCRERIGQGNWQIQPVTEPHTIRSEEQVSCSLDSFLATAASLAALPPLPPGRWQLKEWPDLGGAPDVVANLRVAGLLQRQPLSVAELGSRLDLDESTISACLWALLAAGLLRSGEGSAMPAAAAAAPSPRSGLLARLAQRFGLIR